MRRRFVLLGLSCAMASVIGGSMIGGLALARDKGTGLVNTPLTMTITGESETIYASTSAGGLDDYDGTDVVDTNPNLSFPHYDWVGAPASLFSRDNKGVYDPTVTTKTWSFTAAASAAGSPAYQVDLQFLPSFNAASGIAVQLHDRTTGGTTDLLNAGMQYSFAGTSARTFDLTIGTASPVTPDFTIDIGTICGPYQDTFTRAATNSAATDGFDGAFDTPEPAPAPANYLVTSFEHADWPLGPRFSTDVRATFDPTQDGRTWPLMVETDQSGPVVLTFAPDFDQSAGFGLQLRDVQTDQIFDLFPALSYVFQGGGYPMVRHFELIVGEVAPPDLVPTNRLLPAGWSMVGLPLIPPVGASTVGTVLLDPSPGYAYAYTYARFTGYHAVPPSDGAAPGMGYWLGTSASFTWTMNGTRPLDGVNVALANGWNLVGNANWFPGPVEGLRVIHGGMTYDWLTAAQMGLVAVDVQNYNMSMGTYFDAVDLEPWRAYWVNALATGVTLRFHWPNFQQIPARLAAPPPGAKTADGSWRTDLVLTDAQERARVATFGVQTNATAGFDPLFDRPMPPASPDGGPSLSFQHPDWNLASGGSFTRDLIGPGDAPVQWAVAMSAPTAVDAVLSWDSSNWPEGVDYQLYFPHENRVAVMSMRRQAGLSVKIGPQPLSVVIRTPDLTSGVDELPGGGDYGLSVQPNPFNPLTTVSFDLPRAGSAEVRIYSLRGELVGVLGGHTFEAGRHQESWNGRDRQGRDLPSGSYFGRLYVDGRTQGRVIRMSLVR